MMLFNFYNLQQLLILMGLFGFSVSQRPSYAGSSPKGRPELASRFKDTETSPSTSVNFEDRLGETSTSTTQRIPVDARGDGQLVETLNQWPRENRPFWLLNSDHIEASRHPQPVENNRQGRWRNRNQSNDGTQKIIISRWTSA